MRRQGLNLSPMKRSPQQLEALRIVADGAFYPALVREEEGWFARWLPLTGDNVWVDVYVREAAMTTLSEDAEDFRHETLHDAWIMALTSRSGRVVWDDAECAAFAATLASWSGNAAEDRLARASISFRLVAPEAGAQSSAFALTCAIPRSRCALRALGEATYVWGGLCGLRRSGEELRVTLTPAEADDFLHHGAHDLTHAGYAVDAALPQAAVAVEAICPEPVESTEATGDKLKLQVRINGEVVTADEIRFLLEQGTTFVCFHDHWVEVDRAVLREALKALERGVDKKANMLAFALGIGRVGDFEIAALETHGWLRGLVNQLRQVGSEARGMAASFTQTAVPDGFVGTLRDYQRRGVAWLDFLTAHGFGALLADDMGLGKTVQIIAWLLTSRMSRGARKPCLIVAPLTLLANWRHECARFAPSLKVYSHQGETRHYASGFQRAAHAADVVLTSYSLFVKDYANFADVGWSALVLDEAQAVKNPKTQVARAIRALRPPRRVALTGTPIENSADDVWALEDFLNPGFLGDLKTFHAAYVRTTTHDPTGLAAKRLRHALEPFVLRRVKSDPAIAAELGEKREVREYCELTGAQRREYEAQLNDFRARERNAGDVFALLTRLKLICDGVGKMERLCELLSSIFDAGESALVFTQYTKVGAVLQTELAKRFGRRFPYLHGGLTSQAREAQIRWFETGSEKGDRTLPQPMAFVLSLKAGGFGLNLVKATHVIHYDRWWNPAVESQATDRAYRIGQAKDVLVHLLITSGTLEEHIDELLVRKARVAGSVITAAEWLATTVLEDATS